MLFPPSLLFFWEKTSKTNTNKTKPDVACALKTESALALCGNLTSGRGDKQGWACKMEAGVLWGREEG